MSQTTFSSDQSIKGDRALGLGDDDKLGFRDVAKRITLSLVDRATQDGLVIGLEGPWGSGKSSLLFLIDDELEKLPENIRPTIINFRPWLIGNRDALISALFGEISRQLDIVALNLGDATGVSVAKAKEAGTALKKFAKGLSKTGGVVEFIGKMSGIGAAELAGGGLKALGDAADIEVATPSLSELKDTLAKTLRELNHRIVVTIDDVDRLEPKEVIEILRLVRSVVDLPNIIYLLCYDSNILSHSIENAAGIENGRSYLEKIVQLTIMVPQPEPLQLRQWFTDELRGFASTKNDDERSRLQMVIDYEGGRQLRTPRAVVRALDAMRFFWPPLAHIKADLADLVWLQLIKDGNSELYRWIEEYCATAATVSLGTVRIDKPERDHKLSQLRHIIDGRHYSDQMYYYIFAEQLPGVEISYSDSEKEISIFCRIGQEKINNFIRDKRLASPDHYRLYFALSDPSHVLKQEEFSAVWSAAATDARSVEEILIRLHSEVASGTLTKADLLFERVKGGAGGVLTGTQAENILLALSNAMDEAYRQNKFDLYWIGTLWTRAQELTKSLLMEFFPEQRDMIIIKMFDEGTAIGWLTSVMRHEFYAHGLYGDRMRQEECIFTREQLDKLTSLMINRYKKMSLQDIFSSPAPLSLLFAWFQAGDEVGPYKLIEQNITSDLGLIQVLEGLVTKIQSSSRESYEVLDRKNLLHFMDVDSARSRIDSMTGHPQYGQRARILSAKFSNGDYH